MTTKTKKLPAKLRAVLTKYCPFESTSMRMIQRVCALYVGYTDETITREALFEMCEVAGLDALANFRANFTMNIKKDEPFFSLKAHPASWTLTAAGKAEAKRVFEEKEAPSTQPSRAGKPKATPKPKAKKKTSTKAKKKASTKKKAKAKAKPKAKAKKKTASKKKTSKAKKKAARKKKAKKDTAPAPEPAAEPVAIPGVDGQDDW